jgi:cbb3-type cytochrome oxidase maturation protein
MEVIYLLIPVALIFIVLAVKFFFWAVKDGQFEDMEGPGHSILFDDDAEYTSQDIKDKQTPDSRDRKE